MSLMKTNCKLQRCNKIFKQNREWQKFCCKEHQREYWNDLYKERYNLAARVEKLEKQIGQKES